MKESIIQQKSFQFSLVIIELYRKLQEEREYILSKQLLRSATSIGANVEEASGGQSRKDFLAKMYIAYKEARETKYWLRLLQESKLTTVDVTKEIKDADEIVRIISSIVKTTEESMNVESSNSKLPTPNSQLPTQNSQLKTPNSQLLTPNS